MIVLTGFFYPIEELLSHSNEQVNRSGYQLVVLMHWNTSRIHLARERKPGVNPEVISPKGSFASWLWCPWCLKAFIAMNHEKQQPNPSQWQLSGTFSAKASIISSLTSLTTLTFFFQLWHLSRIIHSKPTRRLGRQVWEEMLNTTSQKDWIPDR